MQNRLVLVLSVVLVLFAASCTFADITNYRWGYISGPRIVFGVEAGALDSYDYNDWLSQPNNYYYWQAGAYHVNNQDGWDGPTGFYGFDIRALLVPGETKTWDIYFWPAPGMAPHDQWVAFSLSCSPKGSDSQFIARMECIQKPAGITGGPDVGTVWTTPPTFTLPYYATSNGLDGYGFRFTLTMLPEPSSLLAMLAGIAGIGGVAWRRSGKEQRCI